MTREEILQAFDDINFVYNDCTRYDTLKRMLEELTERKRGKWIEDGYQGYPCVCSVCGIGQDITAKFLFSFCPNCGSDMRERRKDGE